MDYETRPLTPEEGDALSKEMMELLEKHNAELGVVSSIQILKRVPKSVVSPFLTTSETTGTTGEEKETPEAN